MYTVATTFTGFHSELSELFSLCINVQFYNHNVPDPSWSNFLFLFSREVEETAVLGLHTQVVIQGNDDMSHYSLFIYAHSLDVRI